MKFNLHKFLDVVTLIAPVVLIAVPGGAALAPVIPAIVHGIQEAEQIKGATGAQKKAHVLEIVKDAATAINATGQKVNADELQQVAGQGIDAVIGAVHVIEGAKVVKQ